MASLSTFLREIIPNTEEYITVYTSNYWPAVKDNVLFPLYCHRVTLHISLSFFFFFPFFLRLYLFLRGRESSGAQDLAHKQGGRVEGRVGDGQREEQADG